MSLLPVYRRRVLPPFRSIAGNKDLDQVFDRFFGTHNFSESPWSPSVDVHETDDGIIVHAELPGVKSEDLAIEVEDGVLSISGEKKNVHEELTEGRRVVERHYGSFARRFSLPDTINAEKIDASFEGGVLEVSLPKVPKAKPQKVKIKGSGK